MQKDEQVILGEETEVQLWRFELTLEDRRTGKKLQGETVEVGNEDYDLDEALKSIRKRYSRLGYGVTDAAIKEERIYKFSALKAYEQAAESESGREPQHIENEEDDGDSWQEEIAATLVELDD